MCACHVVQVDFTLPYVVCSPPRETLLRRGDSVFVMSAHAPRGSYDQRFLGVGHRRFSVSNAHDMSFAAAMAATPRLPHGEASARAWGVTLRGTSP